MGIVHGPLAAFIEAHQDTKTPRQPPSPPACAQICRQGQAMWTLLRLVCALASSNLNVTRNRPNLRDTQAIPVLAEQLKGQVWRSGRGLM